MITILLLITALLTTPFWVPLAAVGAVVLGTILLLVVGLVVAGIVDLGLDAYLTGKRLLRWVRR